MNSQCVFFIVGKDWIPINFIFGSRFLTFDGKKGLKLLLCDRVIAKIEVLFYSSKMECSVSPLLVIFSLVLPTFSGEFSDFLACLFLIFFYFVLDLLVYLFCI